ncbi:MAG: universal stress protein [Armatimonadota bacterium]|nr:universal stress protein [Armatimonadota bacterium]MDR7450541.1 universal stress protein [Armatimonadota bacterium]MDR7466326.1 universal stress protein [Armatimonadota bacterium]MDR7493047.1 universal stress protein [Armatimonadota bacterium]MDR7498196.1 universal stress protein [Armatimonadota bacterium]
MGEGGRPILVATDLSSQAAGLFAVARRLGGPDAEIVALHVYSPEDYLEVHRETGMPVDQYVANLKAEMRFQADRAGLPAGRVRCEVAESWSVPEAILDRAGQERAALIVMATHGRTGLRRALEGSVAEEVLRHARTPVLIVPLAALEELRTTEVHAA